eukprot:362928-Chlamydomonas_euryale.AAC.9
MPEPRNIEWCTAALKRRHVKMCVPAILVALRVTVRDTGSSPRRACLCDAHASGRNQRRQEAQQWSTQYKHESRVSSRMSAQARHEHSPHVAHRCNAASALVYSQPSQGPWVAGAIAGGQNM